MKEIGQASFHKGLDLFSKCCASVSYKTDSAMNGNIILKITILSETAYLLQRYQEAAKLGFLLQ